MTEQVPVLNPVDVERKLEELSDRIAKGVRVVTAAEREAAEIAEVTYRHAERTARALADELTAWQSITSSIRTMYGATRA